VPTLDLAEEDVRHGGPVELERIAHILEVVRDGHSAEHRGELEDRRAAETGDVRALQWGVGGAEVHGLLLELLDPPTGADGLVVDLGAGLHALEGLEPVLVHRVGEGRPRASHRDALERAGSTAVPTTPARCGVAVARTRGTDDRKRREGRHHRPLALPTHRSSSLHLAPPDERTGERPGEGAPAVLPSSTCRSCPSSGLTLVSLVVRPLARG